MKKFIYSFLTVGLLSGLASCSSDMPMPADNAGEISINVDLPSFGSRAIGDTLKCNELKYTIYNMSGKQLGSDVTIDAFGDGVTSQKVSLQLVPGESYMVVFYAHNNTSEFSSYSNGNITVDYTKMHVNNEIDDAFYCYTQIEATSETVQSVTLNRAFAQINIGTNDITSPVVEDVISNYKASLSITGGIYTNLKVADNKVSNEEGVSPSVNQTNELTINKVFPVEGYGNLTSVYILAGTEDKQVLSGGTYEITNGSTVVRSVPMENVPVRMNYRTNIYGSMLTTQIPVTVELVPAFNKDDYDNNLDPKPVTVTDGDELIAAVNKGGIIIIPENTEIEIPVEVVPGGSSYGNVISKPTEIRVNGKLSITAPENRPNFTHFYVDNELTFNGGGTLEMSNGQSMFYVYNGGSLTLDSLNVNFTTTNAANPYTIRAWGESPVTINNVNLNASGVGAIFHQGVGPLNISDSEINITGTGPLAEGIETQGTVSTLTNVKVTSSGRCVNSEYDLANRRPFNTTMINCEMYAEGDRVLYFYDQTGTSVLNMDGGAYSCKVTEIAKYDSPVIFGNNQSGKYFTCNVKNVELVNKPWGFLYRENNILYDADDTLYIASGYKWEAVIPATTNPVYQWRVVPE